MSVTPEEFRESIPVTRDVAYFNTGASGPSPRPVVDAVTECLEYHEFVSGAREGMYEAADEVFADAKAAVGELLSVEASEIGLTQSTTDGINLVGNAIDWEPGDVVVRTDLEHGAGILPWARLRDVYGVEVRVVESTDGRVTPDEFKDAVEGARLVCLSSLSWNFGTRLPVSDIVDIAHDAGALVLVDAVQSVGHHPVDVGSMNADFLVGGGHKWLLGPWGSGFLYADPTARRELTPRRIGYRSIDREAGEDEEYVYRDSGQMFEVSTMSVAVYRGLVAAIEYQADLGMRTMHRHMEQLTDQLKSGLGGRLVSPGSFESGLVTFEMEQPEAFVEFCNDRDVVIRELHEPNRVRASVHAFNTSEEVNQLLECVSLFT